MTTTRDFAADAARVAWYHTFELPGGYVTPGYYDLRGIPAKLPIPASLAGKRCLDAASNDGFWAFEMARRGAAEVVSIDLPDPADQDWQGATDNPDGRRTDLGRNRTTFELVRDATGLPVKRVELSVYDVSVEALGEFDYVFLGAILLHLADPVRALRALRSVLPRNGELFSLEQVSLTLTAMSPRKPLGSLWAKDEPRWWTPNMAGHRRLVQAAGFEIVEAGGPLFLPFGDFFDKWPKKVPRRPLDALWWVTTRRLGCPAAWVRAHPSAASFLPQR